MRDFRKLRVWEKSHALTLGVYKATAGFPKDEMYGLTSQVRRSTASIPANIAEGSGRESAAEFVRFLQIAAGSASETEYHLLLASDLGFLPEDAYRRLEAETIEVKKMLFSLCKKARNGP